MIIYSKTSLAFIKKVKTFAKDILINEMGLTFNRTRLYYKKYFYPLEFVVFEHSNILGKFEPELYRISLNKSLIYQGDNEDLKNIIRHELCHFLCYLENGPNHQSHGSEFQDICKRFYYDKNVSSAATEISAFAINNQATSQTETIVNKIKKLLKLAESDNPHEAETATVKANDLLLKHHLSEIDVTDFEDTETCLVKAISGKKVTGKHQAIYEIIKHFFVGPIFNYGKGEFSLEIIGDRVNVETAAYVCSFLDVHLEYLWKETKKNNPQLSGVKSKNSYMKGVSKGFCEKIKSAQNLIINSKQLALARSVLESHYQRAYPKLKGRLTTVRSECSQAKAAGIKSGKDLSINPAIQKSPVKKKFIEWIKHV